MRESDGHIKEFASEEQAKREGYGLGLTAAMAEQLRKLHPNKRVAAYRVNEEAANARVNAKKKSRALRRMQKASRRNNR